MAIAPPERSIHPALLEYGEERARSAQNRIADAITTFAGSMWFVYIHVLWFAAWIALNIGAAGASIVFELRGRTIFEGDAPGRQNLVGWFEADDERYRWLNDIVCIAEGHIDDEGMQIRVYAGVHELEA